MENMEYLNVVISFITVMFGMPEIQGLVTALVASVVGVKVKKKVVESKLTRQIMTDEGFSKTLYQCTEGFNTIGYGRNLDSKGLSETEAKMLFQNDLKAVILNVQNEFDFTKWFKKLSLARKEVLYQMAYQMGFAGLLEFAAMFSWLETGNYDKAADEMTNSQWHRQTPLRCQRLARQMRTGIRINA